MKFFSKLDHAFSKVLEVCSVGLNIAIMVIICLQVLIRNLFSFSLGKLAEYPVYLMIFAVWIAAITVARSNDHLTIELLDVFVKNKKIVKIVRIVMGYVAAVSLLVFAYYGVQYVGTLASRNQIETGTGLPLAFLAGVIPCSAVFQSIYYFVNMGKLLRGLNDE